MSINSAMREISTKIYGTTIKHCTRTSMPTHIGKLIRDMSPGSTYGIGGIIFLKNLYFKKRINRKDYYRKDRGLSFCDYIGNIHFLAGENKFRYGNTLKTKMNCNCPFYKDTIENVRY